ncbi:MAG: restriction endonuclease subunit S [Terriglobales bacterium]
MIPEGWRVLPVGQLTDNFDSLRVPVKESDRRVGPYPYYGASGIVDHVDGYIFEGDYLLIAEDGENLRTRQTPIAFMAGGKFWVNNHAHIVRGNSLALTQFLAYAFQNSNVSAYLTGSTLPKLTQGNLNRIPILTPPPVEQAQIVRVLTALDDKIELNRRMNQTLEAIQRAIFRSWFVNFDPVRAKAAGSSVSSELMKLFPSTFVETELGAAPSGWRLATLGTLCRRVSMGPFGSNIKTDNFVDAGVPVIRGANLKSGFVDEGFVYVTNNKADELRHANAYPDDIAITRDCPELR